MTAGTTPQTLLRQAPQRPALDMALSHALLLRVAEGRAGRVRIHQPAPTVAFIN